MVDTQSSSLGTNSTILGTFTGLHALGFQPSNSKSVVNPLSGLLPLGADPVAQLATHELSPNAASSFRPSLPAASQDPHQPPPTTSSSSLLGRLRSLSSTDRPHTTAVPLAQRLRDPAPLIDRVAPPASLSQRLQSPSPEFVQGSSLRPFQSNSTRSLHQRLANKEEEGEPSDREENVPTSRARRSRRAGRKQKEEDEQQIREGKQPAPGKGKRRDRRDRAISRHKTTIILLTSSCDESTVSTAGKTKGIREPVLWVNEGLPRTSRQP
ncbi:uncharacterized protein LACBIDRAFT_334864 [Laccaria bicolor S238N-H82]|uniref:Predicted protein n=1 Tax=Laccaria bicolor (strain S238N-H82 / ATCC MYA-4686) TaxID=486041 RepID=B0E0L3_LACBS|nr:uncharacterized protein LACBIDRAFT_334864 [Laccaria bicolor S238N-H82]EDQ99637.1 predicted protein [Laccaria bicolor S238N-H82]|eukprot:XP_001889748.1 predicted protein [Laccaria bicolor S238N-H82]